jgi:hypothetical protein
VTVRDIDNPQSRAGVARHSAAVPGRWPGSG